MWNIKNIPNELVNLSKETSRQNVKTVKWLLIASYDKVREGKDKLKFKEQEKSAGIIEDPVHIMGWKINLFIFSIFCPQKDFFK